MYFWYFNIFNPNHWNIISVFWDKGGSIKTANDYIFILSIIAFFLLWLYGLKIAYKINYLRLIFSPFDYLNRKANQKYLDETSRGTAIKNIGSAQKTSIDDMINSRLNEKNAKRASEPENIRDVIKDKINSAKN